MFLGGQSCKAMGHLGTWSFQWPSTRFAEMQMLSNQKGHTGVRRLLPAHRWSLGKGYEGEVRPVSLSSSSLATRQVEASLAVTKRSSTGS